MSDLAPIPTATAGAVGQGATLSGAPGIRMLRHADLTADDRARWAQLSAHAGAANLFAQDWFMDAALRHAAGGDEAMLAVATRGDGPWIGVMPLIVDRRFGRWPVRIWRNWSATNQFLATPLVAPGMAGLFWATLLAHLDAHRHRGLLLCFDGFALNDPINVALLDHCRRERRPVEILRRFDRPMYRPGAACGTPQSGKSRGRMNALSRRLEQAHGSVTVSLLDAAATCDPWIDAFLAMEQAGWKGRGGSALGCDTGNAALFRTVIRRGHANGSVRLATLRAGDRALAMSSWFESGDRGYGFKMAFDEAFRSYGPGQLLMRDIATRIAERGNLHFDTCTGPASGKAHCLWPNSQTIAHAAIALGPPARRLRFRLLHRARALCAAIKRALGAPIR